MSFVIIILNITLVKKYQLYEQEEISRRLTIVTFDLVAGCSKMLCAKPFSHWPPGSGSSAIFLFKHQQWRHRLRAKCILSWSVHATARQPVICCPMPCGIKMVFKLDISQQYTVHFLGYSILHKKQEMSSHPSATRMHWYHFGLAAFVWEFELLVQPIIREEQNLFFAWCPKTLWHDQKSGSEP